MAYHISPFWPVEGHRGRKGGKSVSSLFKVGPLEEVGMMVGRHLCSSGLLTPTERNLFASAKAEYVDMKGWWINGG